VVLLVAAWTQAGGCDGGSSSSNGSTPTRAQPGPSAAARPGTVEENWSAEAIAANPQGYMRYADGRIQIQIEDRQRRQATLADRLQQIEARKAEVDAKFADVTNIRDRFATAIRRAQDEERWPVKIGGRTFDAGQAGAVLAQAQQYLEDNGPLAREYAAATDRLRSAQTDLQRDLDQLKRLRERLALDLERVRLHQGMEELGLLRQTEQEISGYAQSLGQMADEASLTQTLVREAAPPKRHVDLEALMQGGPGGAGK
jgi:hypothetical protein